jgi:DNA-binding NarL/FixJ family response regulator
MASLKGTPAAPGVPGFWDPLLSFAQIADLLGNGPEPGWFGEPFGSDPRRIDGDSLAVLRFASGLYARLSGRPDHAHEHLDACLRLLAPTAGRGASAPERQLVLAAAQTELARVWGDYARAQAWAETAIALARLYGDRYTLAALIGDQAVYTYQQGRFADTLPAARALRAVADGETAPHIIGWSRFFEENVPGVALVEPGESEGSPPRALLAAPKPGAAASGLPGAQLSDRETEVLRLVAAGLSNRAIAVELVISCATVKKHLEHIFAKLEVGRRTAAVARGRHLELLA